MILCLHCRRLWPNQAQICGLCRRSFGGRLCPHGHLSPALSRYCSTCGNKKLLQPAKYLKLGCLTQLLVCVSLLIILKLCIAHFSVLCSIAFGATTTISSFLLGRSPIDIFLVALPSVINIAVTWIVLRIVLGKDAVLTRVFEQGSFKLFRYLIRFLIDSARILCRIAFSNRQSRTTDKNGGSKR